MFLQKFKTELQEIRESNTKYNSNNYNDINYTNPIILSAQQPNIQKTQMESEIDKTDEVSSYIELIEENIDYEQFMTYKDYPDKELYE